MMSIPLSPCRGAVPPVCFHSHGANTTLISRGHMIQPPKADLKETDFENKLFPSRDGL